MNSYEDSIRDLALKHNISEASASQLVNTLFATNGGQAQFNVPEFGGMGQWMPGMIMAGDMFNHALKARVDGVCSDLSRLVRSGELRPPMTTAGESSRSRRFNDYKWWPGDLGTPVTSGGQNNLRYAWFASTQRLAVDLGGVVWIYDTGEHRIGGVSQQQSSDGTTLSFTSQFGAVDLSTLPVVSRG